MFYKFDFRHQIDTSSSNMHLNQTHVTILFFFYLTTDSCSFIIMVVKSYI